MAFENKVPIDKIDNLQARLEYLSRMKSSNMVETQNTQINAVLHDIKEELKSLHEQLDRIERKLNGNNQPPAPQIITNKPPPPPNGGEILTLPTKPISPLPSPQMKPLSNFPVPPPPKYPPNIQPLSPPDINPIPLFLPNKQPEKLPSPLPSQPTVSNLDGLRGEMLAELERLKKIMHGEK